MSWTCLANDKVKARVRHRCFICACSIWPGQMYRRTAFVYDKKAYTIKEHVECARVAAKWCDSFDYPDGYQGEDVQESFYYEGTWKREHRTPTKDYLVCELGDMTRDEQIVFLRMRRSQIRYEIRRLLNA